MKITALQALNYRVNNPSLINPFHVIGLYPDTPTNLDLLPFRIPNPALLDNLPYLFNTVYQWKRETLYQQITDPLSSWHTLTDNCTVNHIVLPLTTAESVMYQGPISINTVTLSSPLGFESNLYTVYISRYIGNTTKRIAHEFHSAFFYRVYLGISNSVVDTYMAVIKDILNGQPDKRLYIKGYSIKYSSDTLFIDEQPYPNLDLPLMGWLMYILFT